MTIEDIAQNTNYREPGADEDVIIKVIGVGGGGNNAVRHMYNQGIKNVSFVICNTDKQALLNSPVPNKLMIGKTGLGAGNKPEVARLAAEESADEIAELFNDSTRMVFITAGMGGGTGTGAAPVVARIAREHEMLTIGIVTIPFLFEGQRKILKALEGAEEMSKYVDALLVINNERLTEIYPDLQFMNAFGKADDTLTTAASGISELITNTNHVINIDFNDVDTTLRNGGAAVISIGYGEGENRVTQAINDALNSPLLKDRDIFGSKRILFNVYYNPEAEHEFVMKEANELTDFIANISPDVDVIWGLAKDTSLGDQVKITLLAAGFNTGDKPQVKLTGNSSRAFDQNQAVRADVSDISKDQEEKKKKTLEELYGGKKVDVISKTTAEHKTIVLSPEQLADDSVIEAFEKNPTFTRERRVAEEIRNAGKKSAEENRQTNHSDIDDDSESKNDRTSGTRINFM